MEFQVEEMDTEQLHNAIRRSVETEDFLYRLAKCSQCIRIKLRRVMQMLRDRKSEALVTGQELDERDVLIEQRLSIYFGYRGGSNVEVGTNSS